ncbi:hypothetical protein JG688_00011419 [Phytophthora aleatoria]|uniref:Uncharacterized protein n=1 Tax=Phytophthora aleatoria TaxID=2496075 RepID=A0A8J5J0J9_9STRA|nr:hypothetical protein JG688_00011419 [Phytophthora aleatoria]
MQLSAPTASLETKQPLFIAEAWSGAAVAQPERTLTNAAQLALRRCIHTATCRLWSWFQPRHGVATTQSCQEELLPLAQPVVLPLSLLHMDFIADSFQDIKTQQQLMHAVLDDVRHNVEIRVLLDQLAQCFSSELTEDEEIAEQQPALNMSQDDLVPSWEALREMTQQVATDD